MKELSIEEKAKAYDEAIKKAESLYKVAEPMSGCNVIIETLFPELKESEDERIRRQTLKVLNYYKDEEKSEGRMPTEIDECIAWLEKQGEIIKEWSEMKFNNIQKELQEMVNLKLKTEQGEQKPNPCDGCINRKGCINCENGELRETEHKPADKIEPKFKIGDTITDPTDSTFTFHINAIKDGKYMESDKDWVLIKEADSDYELVEQKPADNAEPKFHEGDWIIHHGTENIYQVVAHINNQYQLKYGDNYTVQACADVDRCARLWDITKDAKDGDVLACNEEILLFKSYSVQGRISLYCWYNGQTNNLHSKEVVDTLITTRNEICPATKEQHILLFQKMEEAGYTFDFEKKELKKIEQPELTEFEEAVKDMIDDYRDAIDAHAATTEEVKERAAYMLSLIPHKSAEWSEEDERNLDWLITVCKRIYYKSDPQVSPESALMLREWLKSLKDRVQPNQEWSEDDALKIDFVSKLLTGLDQEKYDSQCMKELSSWLKSLKDRVHPKQEWSKEDRRHIEKLILNVNAKEFPDEVDWLISLHEKIAPPYWDKEDEEMLNQAIQEVEYALNDKNIAFSGREPVLLWLKHLRPQSQWKPSDEQLEALEHFVRSVGESSYASPYDNNTKLLYSLLSDLKKLKG